MPNGNEPVPAQAGIAELEAEVARWKRAHQVACVSITQLNDQREDLRRALTNACDLINAMLDEMRVADVTPRTGLLIQKLEFEKAMRKVLGYDQPDRSDLDGQAPA